MNLTGRPISQKPPKPVRGKKGRDHMAKVASLSCVICGYWPVQVHHVICGRYGQHKASDLDTIPLCKACHDELHAGKETWIEAHGNDYDYLPKVRRAIDDMLVEWF